MNRIDFLKTCGMLCIGGISMTSFVRDCAAASKSTDPDMEGAHLIILKTAFERKKRKKTIWRSYIIVEHELLQYPICVFRFDQAHYVAVLMQCTHQGATLQAFGDTLVCPAHGSEFKNDGTVQNGPADTDLRTFRVLIENEHIKIALA